MERTNHTAHSVAAEISALVKNAGTAKDDDLEKQIAAILTADEQAKQKTSLSNRIRGRFLSEWLFGDNRNINETMIEYGATLGIDITLPRRFFALSIQPKAGPDQAAKQMIVDSAQQSVKALVLAENGGIAIASGDSLICGVADRANSQIITFVDNLRKKIESQFDVMMPAGIDTRTAGYIHAHDACYKAEKAMQVCARSPGMETRLYESINMEIFSYELKDSIKQSYINHIFRGCTDEEIPDYIYLLDTLYRAEGSIVVTAVNLGMTKSTLMYKLKKLQEKTGYDPRSVRFSGLFYNAIHFYRDLYERR